MTDEHLTNDLEMSPVSSDSSKYVKRSPSVLDVMTGTYVGHSLNVHTTKF